MQYIKQFLVVAVVLFVTVDYSQGCFGFGLPGRRRRRAIDRYDEEDLVQFFSRKCIGLTKAAKRSDLDLPTVVNTVVFSSQWYNDIQRGVCFKKNDNSKCWNRALVFLLMKTSKLNAPTRRCIKDWEKKIRFGGPKKRVYGTEKNLRPSSWRLPTPKSPLSKCVQSSWKSKTFVADSVTKFLTKHFANCRTIPSRPYKVTPVCVRNKSRDLKSLYERAFMKNSSIRKALASCTR